MAHNATRRAGAVVLHYLGPPGTYSHQVAQKVSTRLRRRRQTSCATAQIQASDATGSDITIEQLPSSTITATLEDARQASAATGTIALALLPYENSSNGPVTDSFDILLSQRGFRIIAEEYLPVRHSLLVSKTTHERLLKRNDVDASKGDPVSKLDAIYSHPQALGQCSKFLDRNCRPDVVRIETTSTGEAARLMAQKGNATTNDEHADMPLEACISSAICTQADVYDLVELKSDIQNSSGNLTRFLLVEVGDEAFGQAQEGTKIFAEPVISNERRASTSSARAIFRVRSDDGAMMSTLDACLHRLYAGSDLSEGQHKPQARYRVRKVDRGSLKSMPSSTLNGTEALSLPQEIWPATYLVDVAAVLDFGTAISSEELDAGKSLEAMAARLKHELGTAFDNLGIWAT